MKRSKRLVAAAMIAGLAACGDGGEGLGGVTADEARQLDEAAELLDNGNAPADGLGEAETGELMVADESATNAR